MLLELRQMNFHYGGSSASWFIANKNVLFSLTISIWFAEFLHPRVESAFSGLRQKYGAVNKPKPQKKDKWDWWRSVLLRTR